MKISRFGNIEAVILLYLDEDKVVSISVHLYDNDILREESKFYKTGGLGALLQRRQKTNF